MSASVLQFAYQEAWVFKRKIYCSYTKSTENLQVFTLKLLIIYHALHIYVKHSSERTKLNAIINFITLEYQKAQVIITHYNNNPCYRK